MASTCRARSTVTYASATVPPSRGEKNHRHSVPGCARKVASGGHCGASKATKTLVAGWTTNASMAALLAAGSGGLKLILDC
jgi:hypothetical protein